MSAAARIGIIGMGWVGSSVAISTLNAGAARELLLHDARAELAEAEAMDLSHGSSFYAPAAKVLRPAMDARETEQLRRSAALLRRAIEDTAALPA